MRSVFNFLSDPVIIFSIFLILSFAVFTAYHFKLNMLSIIRDRSEKLVTHRMRLDNEKTRKKDQLRKIGKREKLIRRKYRMAVSSIKIALNLNFLSVENFTTMFVIFGIFVWGVTGFILDNVFLGFIVAIPSIFASLAFLLVVTKRRIRANDNAVMEALDAICPAVNMGIPNAIKNNMGSYDRRIKHHFEWFLGAIELKGYDFNEAMDELSNRLGPRFYDFADKAKLYYEDSRSGMEDIFRDIIEQNNDVRSDNAELDEIFRKGNNDLFLISGLLIGFLMYMFLNPMTAVFMRETFWGTFLTAIELGMLIMIYAISQLMQMDIPDTVEDEKKRLKG